MKVHKALTSSECGRQQFAYANTETISQSYDTELTRISSPSLNFTYHFDQAGRRTNIDRSGAAVGYGDVFYKYDANGRVNTAGPSSSASQTERMTATGR